MIPFEEFEQTIQDEPELRALVQDIAKDVPPSETTRQFIGVEAAAIGLVVLMLYRFGQNLADWNRGHLEATVVERRVELIQKLTEDGVPFEQASKTVQALETQVQKGRITDSLLEKLLTMFGKK